MRGNLLCRLGALGLLVLSGSTSAARIVASGNRRIHLSHDETSADMDGLSTAVPGSKDLTEVEWFVGHEHAGVYSIS
ncbi:hypothetical protein RQP46_000579 [Phenoliferia psychrophenolica]